MHCARTWGHSSQILLHHTHDVYYNGSIVASSSCWPVVHYYIFLYCICLYYVKMWQYFSVLDNLLVSSFKKYIYSLGRIQNKTNVKVIFSNQKKINFLKIFTLFLYAKKFLIDYCHHILLFIIFMLLINYHQWRHPHPSPSVQSDQDVSQID